ncbi:YdeI/OmpD-associated family protein [Chryseobacterium capnotolerans]|uniref:YdeI/OmpD-associated family protein n=1 Tax=Chryseobacterium capnotolerans TaxID=2759528 RepID=UPI0032119A80
MEIDLEKKTITINTRQEWREWLMQNHRSVQNIWLICNTKKSGLPTVSWGELVDEALCFGWIDSTRKLWIPTHLCNCMANVKSKASGLKSIKKKFRNL